MATRTKDAKLSNYIRGADRGTLEGILLRLCRDNPSVRKEVLAQLQDSYNTPLSQLRKQTDLVAASCIEYGYMPPDVWSEMEDVLEKGLLSASVQADKGEAPAAVEIILYVLQKTVELEAILDEYGDYSSVSDSAFGLLRSIAESASAEDRPEIAQRVIEAAESDRLCGECSGDETAQAAVSAAAPAATPETKDAFRFAIAGEDGEPTLDGERIVWRDVLYYTDGPQAAHDYMVENVGVDAFRTALVDEAVENKDFDTAEKLCRERIARAEASPYGRYTARDWEERLYDILTASGDTEKRAEQALKLVRAGYTRYYNDAKELLTAAGRWDAEYPDVLTQLSKNASLDAYMAVLKSENEIALLLEAARKHRGMLLKYGESLYGTYPDEVVELLSAMIRDQSTNVAPRIHYEHIAQAVERLASLGAKQEALGLISELTGTYTRRRALKEELAHAEGRIRAGRPRDTADSTHWI